MTTQISKKMQRIFVMLVLASNPLLLHAAEFGPSVRAVDAGLGSGFTTAFSRTINGRLGINAFDVDISNIGEQDSAHSQGFGLNSWSALLDWHPFSGGFRLSGGLLHGAVGERQDTGFDAGFTGVNAFADKEPVGLSGVVDFEGTTPYLGIGWGNALTKNGRLGLLVDLGLVFQDDSDINLFSGAGLDTLFNNTLDDYGYLPVFSLGLSYQFD